MNERRKTDTGRKKEDATAHKPVGPPTSQREVGSKLRGQSGGDVRGALDVPDDAGTGGGGTSCALPQLAQQRHVPAKLEPEVPAHLRVDECRGWKSGAWCNMHAVAVFCVRVAANTPRAVRPEVWC